MVFAVMFGSSKMVLGYQLTACEMFSGTEGREAHEKLNLYDRHNWRACCVPWRFEDEIYPLRLDIGGKAQMTGRFCVGSEKMHLVFCQTWIPERTLETKDKLRSEQGAQLVNDTDNVLIAESGASQLWER